MLLEKSEARRAIEQFYIRPARMSDVGAAVELFNQCSNHMFGENEVTNSDVRTEWLLPEFDLESATRVVLTPDDDLVGYIEVWDIDETPVRIWVWGRVHPSFEGLGIGTLLMEWAENRARKAISKVPAGIKVVMEAGSESTYQPAMKLLQDRGMTYIRSFYTMKIDLVKPPPAPAVAKPLSIRTLASKDELRAVVMAVEDSFRDHWGFYDQPFEDEYNRWLHFIEHDEDYDPSLWFLAVDGDEIAGLSLCNPKSRSDPNMGWVSTLGVRRPWRRKGVGLALLHHSFGEFFRRGKYSVGLGVDASSLTGATRLYEKAGMKPIRQFDRLVKTLRRGRDITTQSAE